ncbi:MAG TPA: alanine--tRNA ligase [Candidatus Dormibacteraeota bacterium]
MRSAEIRERFLRFFEERGHHRLPSFSLIPHDDPSLLFTVAGMVPLKPWITGQRTPPSRDLVSCQKCFRGAGLKYDDISSVGDPTHHTFFEMLGNWSIGHYFKEEAIDYAWDFTTNVLGLDPQRLWPSIYPDDAVSERLWVEKIGIPVERIARLTDNWWAAGPTGPCGYDSEIYYDWGGPCSCGRTDCTPQDECEGDRWTEFWNLVFMEFDQQPDGSRPLLPNPTVDTGLGFDRIVAIVQNDRTGYATDHFAPLVDGFRSRTATAVPDAAVRSLYVLADHLRGAGFLIAAGVLPANEGRGYVLRRLVRRAAVHARRVGVTGGLAAGTRDLVEVMGPVYPELVEHQSLIAETLGVEEEAFARTLDAGTERLAALLDRSGKHIDGADAFRLYDTFGLPVELTVEMAAERGATVDLEGFESAMREQRERGQASARRVGFAGAEALPATRFIGYDSLEAEATVTRIGVESELTALRTGERAAVLLDISPFYAEAGGQVGDTGTLEWPGGSAEVRDTQPIAGSDTRAHDVLVISGELRVGQRLQARVDAVRRGRIARHHSATHLLNRALREVLGAGVVQRGSFVGPDHTTFDFSFSRALTPDEIADIEHRVNEGIRHNLERTVALMPLADARASGAIALIDEAYSPDVRVVDFGGWSRELCGGTHVTRSGDLGAAMIVSETSIGQGIRRIELVAGESAEERWQRNGSALLSTARALKTRPEEVPERVLALQEQVKRLTRDVTQARQAGPSSVKTDAAVVEEAGGIRFAHLVLDGDVDADGIAQAGDRLLADSLQGDGVVAVLGPETLVIKVGGRALLAGVNAGSLVKGAADATGGKGGGRPELGRGKIGDPAKREAAVSLLRTAIAEVMGSAV